MKISSPWKCHLYILLITNWAQKHFGDLQFADSCNSVLNFNRSTEIGLTKNEQPVWLDSNKSPTIIKKIIAALLALKKLSA